MIGLLVFYAVVAVGAFLQCLVMGHSREPRALLALVKWCVTWPIWGAWVLILTLLGYGRTRR